MRLLAPLAAGSVLALVIGAAAVGSPSERPSGTRAMPCPDASAAPGWVDEPRDPINAHRFEGHRVPSARRMARRHDCEIRVVRRNGEWLVVTDDFSPSRANVAVRDGRIKRAVGVY